jgi:hypothetical protein
MPVLLRIGAVLGSNCWVLMLVVCASGPIAAGSLGLLQHGAQAGALRGGEVGAHLRAVVVGEDGDLIVGGKGSLQRGQGVVDLLHGVEGHALVDDQRDRQREGIRGEERELLAYAVLIDAHIAPGDAGDLVVLRVLDREGNLDEVDGRTGERKHLGALSGGGKLGLLAVVRVSLRLSRSGGGGSGRSAVLWARAGGRVKGASFAGRNVVQRGKSLRPRAIG